jgi:hypothetical protein
VVKFHYTTIQISSPLFPKLDLLHIKPDLIISFVIWVLCERQQEPSSLLVLSSTPYGCLLLYSVWLSSPLLRMAVFLTLAHFWSLPGVDVAGDTLSDDWGLAGEGHSFLTSLIFTSWQATQHSHHWGLLAASICCNYTLYRSILTPSLTFAIMSKIFHLYFINIIFCTGNATYSHHILSSLLHKHD